MRTLRLQVEPPVATAGTESVVVLRRDARYEPEPEENWRYLDEYFPRERWDEIYDRARAISDAWYRAAEIGDLLSFAGVSLAAALQWPVFSFALQVLRDLIAFEELAAGSPADRLCVPPLGPALAVDRYDPGLSCHLARRWFAKRGTKVEDSTPQAGRSGPAPRRFSLPLAQRLLGCLPCRPRGGGRRPAVLLTDPVVTRFGDEVPGLLAGHGYEVVVADRDGRGPRRLASVGVAARSWRDFRVTNPHAVHAVVGATVARAQRAVPWRAVAQAAGVPEEAEEAFELYARDCWLPGLGQQAEHVSLGRDLVRRADLRAAVVCYAWSGYERLLLETLRNANVPTLTLIHGLISEPRGYCPVLSDYVATFGEADRGLLVGCGVPAARVRSVGCPRFDAASRRPPAPPAPVAAGRARVLLVTQADAAAVQATGAFLPTRRFVAMAWQALRAESDLQLCVRLHPADDITAEEQQYWSGLGIVLAAGGRLYDWLDSASVVVVQNSTVGLEALLRDRPLVAVNLGGQPERIPYADRGVACAVHHPGDLVAAIRSACRRAPHTEESRRRFIADYAHAADGRAAERLAGFVDDIASKRA